MMFKEGLMLRGKRVVTLIALLLLLAIVVPWASAQQPAGGSGLSISPTVSEYTLKPNQSTTINITLKNVALGNITAQATVNDFTADGTTGNPRIITQPGVESPSSIRRFVYNLKDVPLQRGEQKKLSIGLQIPKNTPPGAYYGVIRYKAVPAGANAPAPGQVALTASVGTIVLVTVPGDLHNQVQLSAVHVYRGDHDGSFFVAKPDKLGVEVANLGNGFAKPFGTVELQNMFGKEVYNYQFNNPKQLGNILPKSSRIFVNPIKNINQIGHYTVTVSASYGSGSNILYLKKTFWYVPLWLVVLILAVLAILILLTLRLYVRYRRDRRHTYRR